jgi:hypothetical protein
MRRAKRDDAVTIGLRILQGVQVLHGRRHQQTRVLPGVSPSGTAWRVSITAAPNVTDRHGFLALDDWDAAVNYTSASHGELAGLRVTSATTPGEVADTILYELPHLEQCVDDADYARWFSELVALSTRHHDLPVAYADGFDHHKGWEVGWGTGVRHPGPPGVGSDGRAGGLDTAG